MARPYFITGKHARRLAQPGEHRWEVKRLIRERIEEFQWRCGAVPPLRRARAQSGVTVALIGRSGRQPRPEPGKALPPYWNTDGTLQRTMPIMTAGRVLSQPANPTSPS